MAESNHINCPLCGMKLSLVNPEEVVHLRAGPSTLDYTLYKHLEVVCQCTVYMGNMEIRDTAPRNSLEIKCPVCEKLYSRSRGPNCRGGYSPGYYFSAHWAKYGTMAPEVHVAYSLMTEEVDVDDD